MSRVQSVAWCVNFTLKMSLLFLYLFTTMGVGA